MPAEQEQKNCIGRRSLMKATGLTLLMGVASCNVPKEQSAQPSTQGFGCITSPPLGEAKPKPKDETLLSDEDFKNTVVDRKKGFQVKLRVDYYRCMHLDEVHNIFLNVDGTEFGPENMVFFLDDHRYKVEELRTMRGVYWQVLDYATLFVAKADGLSSGEHDVEVRMMKKGLAVAQAELETVVDRKRLALEVDI